MVVLRFHAMHLGLILLLEEPLEYKSRAFHSFTMFGVAVRYSERFVLPHFIFRVLPELDFTLHGRAPRDQSELMLTGIMFTEDLLDLVTCPLHFSLCTCVEPPLVAHDCRSDLESGFCIQFLLMARDAMIELLFTVGELDDLA